VGVCKNAGVGGLAELKATGKGWGAKASGKRSARLTPPGAEGGNCAGNHAAGFEHKREEKRFGGRRELLSKNARGGSKFRPSKGGGDRVGHRKAGGKSEQSISDTRPSKGPRGIQ